MADKNRLVCGHMFLYAKGWYRHTVNLWEGYRRAINADGIYTVFDIHEVAFIMFRTLTQHKEAILGKRDDYDEHIFEGINKAIADFHWPIYREWVKDMNAAQIHSMAVIYFCHNAFQFCNMDIFDKVLIPSNKVLLLHHHYGAMNNKEEYDNTISQKNWFNGAKPYDTEYQYGKSTYKYLKTRQYLCQAIRKGELHYQGINC